MTADPDDDLIPSITPDVMKRLERSGFFEKLDGLLCPTDPTQARERCSGDYRLSETILRASGFDSAALSDIFDVLQSQGGFGDCEILYNAVESSRLKAEYWQSRAKKMEGGVRHESDSSSGQK